MDSPEFSWAVAICVGIGACLLYNIARFTWGWVVIPLWLVTLWWLASYLTHDFSPEAFAAVRLARRTPSVVSNAVRHVLHRLTTNLSRLPPQTRGTTMQAIRRRNLSTQAAIPVRPRYNAVDHVSRAGRANCPAGQCFALWCMPVTSVRRLSAG